MECREFRHGQTAHIVGKLEIAPVLSALLPNGFLKRGTETLGHFTGVFEQRTLVLRHIDGCVKKYKFRLTVEGGHFPFAFESQAFILLGDVRQLALDGSHVASENIECGDGFKTRVLLGKENPLNFCGDLPVLGIHRHHPCVNLDIWRRESQ